MFVSKQYQKYLIRLTLSFLDLVKAIRHYWTSVFIHSTRPFTLKQLSNTRRQSILALRVEAMSVVGRLSIIMAHWKCPVRIFPFILGYTTIACTVISPRFPAFPIQHNVYRSTGLASWTHKDVRSRTCLAMARKLPCTSETHLHLSIPSPDPVPAPDLRTTLANLSDPFG